MKKYLLSLLMIGACVTAAFAAGDEEKEQINLVGVGVLVSSSPYDGQEAQVYPVPIGVWRNEHFFIEGTEGGVILKENDDFRADVILSPRLMGYEEGDTDILDGMKDRDVSLDGGVQFTWKMPFSDNLHLSFAAVNDLLGKSDGHQLNLQLKKVFPYSFFQIVPKVGVKWMNEDIVDYYFGVTGEEITANRPQYGGHDTFNYYGNVSLYMAISEKWFIILRGGAEYLGDEIQDSPLVDKEVTFNGVFGLTRSF